MNRIIEHQNDVGVLDMLSAQHNLYSAAKRWRNARFLLCVLSVVVLSALHAIMGDNEAIGIILSITVFLSLLVGPWFNKIIDKNRYQAARIRQQIDVELFGHEWDESLWGTRPTPEEVFNFKSTPIPDTLYDWYDKGIGEIEDNSIAELLCQRENTSYDSHIRVAFTRTCKWVAGVLSVAIFATAIILFKTDWLSVVVFGLLPTTPIVRWVQTVVNENGNDKEVREMLESLVNGEMENAIKGRPVRVSKLTSIRNLMFIHRRDGYLVPNTFYEMCRDKSESRAAYSVQDFLVRYNRDSN